jgi:hypothetical protein
MNNTIQYYHDKQNNKTYAIDVNFNREDLLETIHAFSDPIQFLIGVSYVNPIDVYCKSIGRKVSSKSIKAYASNLTNITIDKDKCYLYFECKDLATVFTFRLNKFSEKPHFISANPIYFW